MSGNAYISNAHNAMMMLGSMIIAFMMVVCEVWNWLLFGAVFLSYMLGLLTWMYHNDAIVREANSLEIEKMRAEIDLMRAKRTKYRNYKEE